MSGVRGREPHDNQYNSGAEPAKTGQADKSSLARQVVPQRKAAADASERIKKLAQPKQAAAAVPAPRRMPTKKAAPTPTSQNVGKIKERLLKTGAVPIAGMQPTAAGKAHPAASAQPAPTEAASAPVANKPLKTPPPPPPTRGGVVIQAAAPLPAAAAGGAVAAAAPKSSAGITAEEIAELAKKYTIVGKGADRRIVLADSRTTGEKATHFFQNRIQALTEFAQTNKLTKEELEKLPQLAAAVKSFLVTGNTHLAYSEIIKLSDSAKQALVKTIPNEFILPLFGFTMTRLDDDKGNLVSILGARRHDPAFGKSLSKETIAKQLFFEPQEFYAAVALRELAGDRSRQSNRFTDNELLELFHKSAPQWNKLGTDQRKFLKDMMCESHGMLPFFKMWAAEASKSQMRSTPASLDEERAFFGRHATFEPRFYTPEVVEEIVKTVQDAKKALIEEANLEKALKLIKESPYKAFIADRLPEEYRYFIDLSTQLAIDPNYWGRR